MTLPWGIIALSLIGLGVLYVMLTDRERLGRTIERGKQKDAVLKAIREAHEAKRKAGSVPDTVVRDRMREWTSE